MEEEKQTFGRKFKTFCKECWRVLKVTKKPTMKEFKVVSMVAGIMILIIGFIGFVLTIGKQLLFQ